MQAAVDKPRGTEVLDARPSVILLTGAAERPPACAGRRALSLMRMGAGWRRAKPREPRVQVLRRATPCLANVWQGWPCACPAMRARWGKSHPAGCRHRLRWSRRAAPQACGIRQEGHERDGRQVDTESAEAGEGRGPLRGAERQRQPDPHHECLLVSTNSCEAPGQPQHRWHQTCIPSGYVSLHTVLLCLRPGRDTVV